MAFHNTIRCELGYFGTVCTLQYVPRERVVMTGTAGTCNAFKTSSSATGGTTAVIFSSNSDAEN